MGRKQVEAEIILTNSDVPLPGYKTKGSAGFDLTNQSGEEIFLGSGCVTIIPTGIKIKLPEGYVGMLTPRSGKSISGFSVNNAPGIIDDDYRDEIKVIAINNGIDPVRISKGERIAQLVVVEYTQLFFNKVAEFSPDDFNDRTGGLGSTGSY